MTMSRLGLHKAWFTHSLVHLLIHTSTFYEMSCYARYWNTERNKTAPALAIMELESNKKKYHYLNNLGTQGRGLARSDAYFKTRYYMIYIEAFSKGSQEIDVKGH